MDTENKPKRRKYVKRDSTPTAVGMRNGFSPATIYSEIKKGNLRAKRLGKRTFIPPEYEAEWISNMPDVVVGENGNLS